MQLSPAEIGLLFSLFSLGGAIAYIPSGTWLILDLSKTRLRTCTMGERHVTCIRIEED